MTNDQLSTNFQSSAKVYDLEERTVKFGKTIIDFVRILPQDIVTKPLINQIVRSGTSVGANYCEADEASSKKDFANKISIAKKETRETRYWLKMLAHSNPNFVKDIDLLAKEALELNLIFAAIIRKVKN